MSNIKDIEFYFDASLSNITEKDWEAIAYIKTIIELDGETHGGHQGKKWVQAFLEWCILVSEEADVLH